MRVAAVVLTAGRSQRMGRANAWLELDGETLQARVARVARAAGADPLVIVAGCDEGDALVSREQIAARLPLAAEVVVGAPDGHPIDSLRAGLARVPDDSAVFLWPVDHPFADGDLLAAMIGALGAVPNRIVVPETPAGWGHPVLLGPTVVVELRSPIADRGAHAVVRRDPERIVRVPWADERIAAELNTPEQAAALGVRTPKIAFGSRAD